MRNRLSKQSRAFLEHVAQTRNSKTHLAYSSDLRQYEEWLRANGESVRAATEDVVREYLAYLERDKGRTMWSVHRAATSLRQLHAFLGRPLAKQLYPVRRTQGSLSSTRRALSRRDIDRLFSVIGNETPVARRDRAMFMLMYGLGFVVKDVVNLDVDQISLRDQMIRPHGKSGNKRMTPRVVPLGGEVAGAVADWMGRDGRAAFELNRGARLDKSATFVGVGGQRITRQGITHILKRYAVLAGLPAAISPIWLRDSFTKHMSAAGANPHDIDLINGSIAFVGLARNTSDFVAHARAVLGSAHPYWEQK